MEEREEYGTASKEYILRTPPEYTLPGVRSPSKEYLLPGRSTPGNPGITDRTIFTIVRLQSTCSAELVQPFSSKNTGWREICRDE